MSSLRKIESARANGARSHGPVTAEGKQRSAQNAMRHGLLARCVVLDNEAREGFDALFELHLDRLQPADGVEFGFIEEMVSSYWRMRRAWAIETRLLQKRLDDQPGADELSRLAGAFENLAASQSIGLIHRYETRLHCMYQRALKNLLLLRKAGMPNEPNPISEHPEGGPGEAPTGNPQPPAPPEMPNEPNPVSGQSGSGPDELPPPSPQSPEPPEMPNEPNPISEQCAEDPARRFVEDQGCLFFRPRLKRLHPLARFVGHEPGEVKRVRRQPRGRQRRQRGGRAGDRLHRNAALDGGPDQAIPRIGNQRHAGIRHQRDHRARPQPRRQFLAALRLVVLVVTDGGRLDSVVRQKHARPPRILAGDQAGLFQHPHRAEGDVLQVPDGRGDKIEQAGHSLSMRGGAPNAQSGGSV